MVRQLAEALIQRQPDRVARNEALEKCLDKLPEKSRQMLALSYEEDAPMKRVAESIESSAGAVRDDAVLHPQSARTAFDLNDPMRTRNLPTEYHGRHMLACVKLTIEVG